MGVAVVTVSFDPNLLLSWYQAKANLAGAAFANAGSTATAASAAKVPTAPWNSRGATPADSTLVTDALGGKAFIDEKAAKVDVANADADYKKLFAINQGLSTLQALANAANDPKTPSYKLASIQQQFNRGMSEISTYVEASKFDNFRLTPGIATGSETSAGGVPSNSDTYTTAVLATGSADAAVAAFQGNVQFDMTVTKSAATATKAASTTSIHFDLADLGAAPRTMNSVASYINGKLIAAGVGVRVAVDKSQTADQTVTVNGKPVTISAGQTNLAFKLSGLSLQSATFSAPTADPAVYIAQTAGDPNPDGNTATNDGVQQQELVKFEAGSGADAARRPGDQNYVAGRVFSETLPVGVTTVHATATGADGSVYMVADGSGTVAGQPIKGAQDAVLLKYDSAGNLAYTQTLGAGVSASGLALAVSADGKVAIAGAVTGLLDNGDAGVDPKTSDSFVTVFDSKGSELWTQRQGAFGADQAQALAFDATGNLYVAGQTQGTITGGAAVGGLDGYLRAYDAKGAVQSTRQFGSAGDDSVGGLVVNGNSVLVAGQDSGAAVVRSFDISNPKQLTLTASRNLGGLGGGSVGAIGLDAAGNVLIGGSTGANLNLATTLARGGGKDGFGARISADLTSTAADAVAYYGGSGADQATAATVAGGKVWLAGTTKTDLPGLTAVGKQDGFVAALDVGAGAVTYSQRFTAKDQINAPESIAVDTSGGSALDSLGLPKGTIGTALAPGASSLDPAHSVLVTTATSLRAGDQFQMRVDGGSPITISIAATDTLSSLAAKIQQAGFLAVKVQTVFNGTGTGLQLTPASDRHTFELLPGAAGRDALTSLGLKAGLVRNTIADKVKGVVPADKGHQTYGLRFTAPLDLTSPTDIKAALDGVGNAITTVRAIYADLKQAATPQSASANQGPVPAYLQNRIADYQSALARLTSGGSDTSSGSSLASLFG
ncbi:MAG: regulatory protein FlaEY [Phenylobacterium sp.]|nr:regulatory protein FlaEY [Phenylobacterium sp.]